jgi:hypothetical protein
VLNYISYGSQTVYVVGRCIYCGSADEPLTGEHAIPYGLGGHLVLREASCKPCQTITCRFENDVLHKGWGLVRTKCGFPSRTPKKNRPKTTPIELVRQGSSEVVQIPIEHDPGIITLPELAPPGCISGRDAAPGTVEGYNWRVIVTDGGALAAHMQRLGVKEVRVWHKSFEYSLARMLSKIAYCFAVFEVGLDWFEEVFVLPGILGNSGDLGRWVGGVDRPVLTTGDGRILGQPHLVATSTAGPVIGARIQLFGGIDPEAPEYFVCVGRRKPA